MITFILVVVILLKPSIGKDDVVYSFHMNGLTAYSKEGNMLWRNTSVKGNYGKNYIALDKEDNVYTVNNPDKYVKVSKQGAIKWEYSAGNNFSGIVIDGFSNLYFTSFAENKLFCLNNSGQLKWTKQNVYGYASPVISSANKILVSQGGYIISYDTSGTEIWRCQPFTNLTGAEELLLDDADNVYYIGEHGGIYAGSITSVGIKRWEVYSGLNSSTLPPPALLPQGKMLIAPKRAFKIQAIN